MRIVSGQYKGRRLMSPSWNGLRPTSDKLRETLFNIVAPRVAGARVLDGYAGTGAIGLEALSRGAAYVVFVERHRAALALIEENLRQCGVEGGYTIEAGDLATVLRRPDRTTGFDLIVLDPPYDEPPDAEVLDVAASHLAPDGVLVLERATRREPVWPVSLERVRDVKSGDSTLTFFRRGAGASRPSGPR
jgi:16S rRNA (guanine(966)-N(2))-methyltransferase RsmD